MSTTDYLKKHECDTYVLDCEKLNQVKDYITCNTGYVNTQFHESHT